MKIFELINPSDKYVFKAPNLEIATIVTFILGEGKYAAKEEGGDLEVPLFLFGGSNEWCQETFGMSVDDLFTKHYITQEVADALDSVLIGSAKDYLSYEKALSLIDDPIKKDEYKAFYLDKRRSSMNNIGKYANGMANAIRKKLKEKADVSGTQATT